MEILFCIAEINGLRNNRPPESMSVSYIGLFEFVVNLRNLNLINEPDDDKNVSA